MSSWPWGWKHVVNFNLIIGYSRLDHLNTMCIPPAINRFPNRGQISSDARGLDERNDGRYWSSSPAHKAMMKGMVSFGFTYAGLRDQGEMIDD